MKIDSDEGKSIGEEHHSDRQLLTKIEVVAGERKEKPYKVNGYFSNFV